MQCFNCVSIIHGRWSMLFKTFQLIIFFLVQGFFDLFRLPLQQYNKDGRIMRGFQLGAQSFSARTAFAALEITSRIIHLLQVTTINSRNLYIHVLSTLNFNYLSLIYISHTQFICYLFLLVYCGNYI